MFACIVITDIRLAGNLRAILQMSSSHALLLVATFMAAVEDSVLTIN